MRFARASMLAAAVTALGLTGTASAAISAAQVVADIRSNTFGNAPGISAANPYSGQLIFKYNNFDVGRLYGTIGGATPGKAGRAVPANAGESNASAIAQMDAAAASFPAAGGSNPTGTLGLGGNASEDDWGVLQVTTVLTSNGDVLWQNVGPTYEITGMFWNESDTYIDQVTTAGHQLIHGVGMQFALYTDTSKDFSPASIGPAGRVGAAGYKTATLLNAAGTTDPDASLFLTANSITGADTTYPLDQFFSDYNPSALAGAANVGDGKMNIDLGTNDAGTGPANSFFQSPGSVRFTGVTPSVPGWTVQSQDPLTISVPEPTSLSLLALSALGLLRQRRRA